MSLLLLVLMALVTLVGLHMIVQPKPYVGRGPIPARDTSNVRAMGMFFTLLGGSITLFFTAPIFLLQFVTE
ncbi:hypothetical protein HNP52_000281 [Sphingomonas kyeonggiensis]|uniref:Uncharacterized protein n=1 Tax=Sphingomonas kyeonggiensis TaxID=1268553 RepID=A0A7W7NPL4_9SPHN|nr:hypothetical protein [Sphingomonas kyeonggiensis]MBB4837230.1 hypothetical protein [Sphingomonas kyeonggiensis]